MTYQVLYSLEINPHEIITEFMENPEVSPGTSDEKNRPYVSFALVEFSTFNEAVLFAEYYARHCCHTELKANNWRIAENGQKQVEGWMTIQDYHLYETVYIQEVQRSLFQRIKLSLDGKFENFLKNLKERYKQASCKHDYEIVHEDNAVRLERCKKCPQVVKYGG